MQKAERPQTHVRDCDQAIADMNMVLAMARVQRSQRFGNSDDEDVNEEVAPTHAGFPQFSPTSFLEMEVEVEGGRGDIRLLAICCQMRRTTEAALKDDAKVDDDVDDDDDCDNKHWQFVLC